MRKDLTTRIGTALLAASLAGTTLAGCKTTQGRIYDSEASLESRVEASGTHQANLYRNYMETLSDAEDGKIGNYTDTVEHMRHERNMDYLIGTGIFAVNAGITGVTIYGLSGGFESGGTGGGGETPPTPDPSGSFGGGSSSGFGGPTTY